MRAAAFAGRLRALREARGLDRKVLEELCGLSPCAAGRYERGDRTPDITTAMALAEFLEVSLDTLCGFGDGDGTGGGKNLRG